jgi:sugar phosphate isomerase/epimerase
MVTFGICGGPDMFAACPEGMDFLECTVSALVPLEDDAAFADALAALQGGCAPFKAANCFLPGDLKTTGPDVDEAALDAYVDTVMARAKQLGLQRIVFGSGGSRQVPDGFDKDEAFNQMIGHCRRFGDIAAKYGVTIVIEPLQLAECNIINTVTEGIKLAKAADHPNVKVLADFYHMACDGEGPESILAAGDLLQHVHVAEKEKRTAPGMEGDDLRPYLKALKEIGYDGMISIEASFGDDAAAQAPLSLAELRKQYEEA